MSKLPNLSEKLAAALLRNLELEHQLDMAGTGPGKDAQEPIPDDVAREMTAAQIISLFECDHWPIRREDGGSNHPTNLRFRLYREHRDKTNKIDRPQSAKGKRLRENQALHLAALDAKRGEDAEAIRSRILAMPNGKLTAKRLTPKRGIRSAGFNKSLRRPMDPSKRPIPRAPRS